MQLWLIMFQWQKLYACDADDDCDDNKYINNFQLFYSQNLTLVLW